MASQPSARTVLLPRCTLCGRIAERTPLCVLVPEGRPLCWTCVAGFDGSVVGHPRGPVILYRANPGREAATDPRSPAAPARNGAPDEAHDGEEGDNENSLSARLSAREMEVVQLVSWGMTNAEIAYRLQRSSSTVAKHVSHALRKMSARNRAELVAATMLPPIPA